MNHVAVYTDAYFVDMLTQTVTMLDERITATEDRVAYFMQESHFTNANNISNMYVTLFVDYFFVAILIIFFFRSHLRNSTPSTNASLPVNPNTSLSMNQTQVHNISTSYANNIQSHKVSVFLVIF